MGSVITCKFKYLRLKNHEHKQVANVKLYINGQFVDSQSGASFENKNPFTNEINNYIAEGREADINQAVLSAKEAFVNGPWGKMKLKERMKYINRIADIIDEEIEEIAF